MEGRAVKLILDHVIIKRGHYSLTADGIFSDGIHLISGDVGSGKSTLALSIMGLLSGEKGSVSWEGIKSSLLLFQFPEYHITGSTLEDECKSFGLAWQDFVSSADFPGQSVQSPYSLSRGELTQFYLSCFMKRNTDLLLLDEPFGSLDCELKKKLCDRLSSRTTGITIIFTHERIFLPRVHRIWEIKEGILLERGPVPDAIRRWSGAPATIKKLIKEGKIPHNISYDDIMEALCRM